MMKFGMNKEAVRIAREWSKEDRRVWRDVNKVWGDDPKRVFVSFKAIGPEQIKDTFIAPMDDPIAVAEALEEATRLASGETGRQIEADGVREESLHGKSQPAAKPGFRVNPWLSPSERQGEWGD